MTPQEELAALRRLAELEAKAGGQAATQDKPESPVSWGGLESFGHGFVQGLGDEATAAGAAVRKVGGALSDGWRPDSLSGIGSAFGDAYNEAAKATRQAKQNYREDHPVASFATEGGGAVASALMGGAALKSMGVALPDAATVGGRVLQNGAIGAGQGALYGFNEGEDGIADRLKEGGKGAALGGGMGMTIPAVAQLAGNAARKLAQPILDRLGPQSAADRQIIRALQDAGIPLDEVQQRLTALGPEATLADLIPNFAELVANTPGKGAEAARVLLQRMEGQGARLADSVNKNLSSGDRFATFDELGAKRSADARPLYEEAFKGGSTAPLQTQLENAFAEAVSAEREAAKQLQAAQNGMTVARGTTHRAGNDVYMANGAFAGERGAAAQMQAAQKALDEAQSAKNAVLERLRMSQEDAATGAPGAVWSPRIQQFLDDPISRPGLSRGMEVQRLEALRDGRRFDPTELAITGSDAAGEPVVSKVPNLRTLDAVKRGLDAIIEDARDGVTKQINWNDRLVAIDGVRRQLVRELDGLTGGEEGAYAQARSAWAGPSQGRDALAHGTQFAQMDPRQIGSVMGKMGDSERDLFRMGVADKIKEMITRTQDGADATRRIFGNERIRQQLEAVFPDAASFNAFRADIEREALFARNRNQIAGNSRTAYRQAGQEDMGVDPSGPLMHGLTGNFGAAAMDTARQLANLLKRPPRAVADEAAPSLFTRGDNAATVARLGEKGRVLSLGDAKRRSLARLLAEGSGVSAGVGVAR